MKTLLTIIFILAILLFLGWLGLQIKPRPFAVYSQKTPVQKTVPLTQDLPGPVERFYRKLYGENIPVIETAVISGRGTMRLFNVTIPIRFRFTHEAGKTYRHDVDLSFFGFPVIKSYETFRDGHGWAKTPGGIDQGEGMDQGSNVSLWAEALNWFSAVLVTDPQVHWEAVDDTTALLITPAQSGHEVFVVRFDPDNGQMKFVEAMKYRSATREKMLWINGTWFDEGKPWIHFDVEDVLYNVDVHDYIWTDTLE
jgi:hypothetical protein